MSHRTASDTPGTAAYRRKNGIRREPFTDFLVRRTDLEGSDAPSQLSPLFYLAGYPRLGQDPRTFSRVRRKWIGVLQQDAELRRWLRSPAAFIPPEEWPAEVQEALDERDLGHLLPGFWARDFLPEDSRTRRYGVLYRFCRDHWEGLGALSALANGWPGGQVPPEALEAIPGALDALLDRCVFQVWAWNPYLECIPAASRVYRSAIGGAPSWRGKKGGRIRGADDMGVLSGLESRAILEQDPLAVSVSDQFQSMGKHSRRLIPSLPRREWTSRSTRPNMVGLYYDREPVRF